MRYKKQLFFFLFFSLILISSVFCIENALATSVSQEVKSYGQKIYGGTPESPPEIAALIIKTVLTFLGIVFLAVIIYGGYLYMTAAGEPEKLKKAKRTIVTAVIGFVIILISYSLTNFILRTLGGTSGTGTGTPSDSPPQDDSPPLPGEGAP